MARLLTVCTVMFPYKLHLFYQHGYQQFLQNQIPVGEPNERVLIIMAPFEFYICFLRTACSYHHLNLCKIENYDFLKLCHDKGLY